MTSPLLIITIILFVSSSASVTDARMVLMDPDRWSNFSLDRNSSLDSHFVFVPSDDRGAGSLLFSALRTGAIFGAHIQGYKYRSPIPEGAGRTTKSSRLTLDVVGNELGCPVSWLNFPNDDQHQVVMPISEPSINASFRTTTDEFFLLATALYCDLENRVIIHSDALQILTRIEATGVEVANAVRSVPAGYDPNNTVAGSFAVSILWSKFCNSTRSFSPPPLPENKTEWNRDPPKSGELTMREFLETGLNVHSPTFIDNDAVVFFSSHFPCLWYAGPETFWKVKWFFGNCSQGQAYVNTSAIDFSAVVHRLDAVAGTIRSLHFDKQTSRVFVCDSYGLVRQIDLVTGNTRLVMGKAGVFKINQAACDSESRCSPFLREFLCAELFVLNTPENTISQSDTWKNGRVFCRDSTFGVLYSVEIHAQILYTELAVSQHERSEPTDCHPRAITAKQTDLFVQCEDRVRVFRKRLMKLDPLPHAVDALPLLEEATANSITGLAIIVGTITGTPTVAVTASRTRAVMALARCSVSMAADGNTRLGWSESPTQLGVAGPGSKTNDFIYQTGAVLGNLAVLLVPFAIHFLIVKIKTHNKFQKQLAEYREKNNKSPLSSSSGNAISPSGVTFDATAALINSNTAATAAAGGGTGGGSSGASLTPRNNNNNNNDDDDDNNNNNTHFNESDKKPEYDKVKLEVEAAWRFPSASLIFVYMFLVEPTIRCSAFLLQYVGTAEGNYTFEILCGLLGILITVIGLVLIFYFVYHHWSSVFFPTENALDADEEAELIKFLSSKSTNDMEEKEKEQADKSCSRRFRELCRRFWSKWRGFSNPFGAWKDNKNRQEARFGSLVKPYQGLRDEQKLGRVIRYYSLFELGSAAALGALTGLKTDSNCAVISILSLLVLVIFFTAGIVLRPLSNPYDNVYQTLIAGFSFFSGLFVLFAALGSGSDFVVSCFHLSETFALVAAFLVGLDAFFDIGTRAFKVLKFLADKYCCKDGAEKEEEEEDTTEQKTNINFQNPISATNPYLAPGTQSPISIQLDTRTPSSGDGTIRNYSFDLPPPSATSNRIDSSDSSGNSSNRVESGGMLISRQNSADLAVMPDSVARQIMIRMNSSSSDERSRSTSAQQQQQKKKKEQEEKEKEKKEETYALDDDFSDSASRASLRDEDENEGSGSQQRKVGKAEVANLEQQRALRSMLNHDQKKQKQKHREGDMEEGGDSSPIM